ncbi:MAG: Holliday junction branch migration DNA helicase RuvB [Parcubacteria group bacterium]|nr:Holliday junction branch migration DNA helicase RuvB [Parcubacteria group bacterium]
MIVKDPPQLRPATFAEYIGQEKLKNQLRVILEAAKKRGEPLEHLLFYGNSGLGKTTLAHVVGNDIGAALHAAAGPSLERTGDIASLLTSLEEGDILFLDECHRVPKPVLEMLYSAMEDFKLHLVIGKGPMARTMELDIPRFTLIGATTRMAQLPSPFRNRFGAIFHFSFYTPDDMEHIVKRSASILGMELGSEAVRMVAASSRLTPRVANRLLRRIRDFASIEEAKITADLVKKALEFLEIDEWGLERTDRRILEVLVQKFKGGPVGIQALASALSEEEETILDVYEPFLMRLGFIERTPKGRMATPLVYKHLQLPLLG